MLLVINEAPGIGTSTVAHRYVLSIDDDDVESALASLRHALGTVRA